MSDVISRQVAISAICSACGKIDCDKMDKCEKLQLPPANCSEFPNSSDTISRQQAIDMLRGYLVGKRCPDDGTLTCRLIENEVINKLPPAQPETAKRIVGKSRDGMTLWYQCDMCNEPVDVQDNYCRGCGRRLIDE